MVGKEEIARRILLSLLADQIGFYLQAVAEHGDIERIADHHQGESNATQNRAISHNVAQIEAVTQLGKTHSYEYHSWLNWTCKEQEMGIL